MPRKRKSDAFFKTGSGQLPEFGTGVASEILDIPVWRLQKFLDSGQYNLDSAGKLGRGRGSRRVFSQENLRRIALANWLIKDGFTPQFVGSVVQQLSDTDMGGYTYNDEGEEEKTSLSVTFCRGKDGPSVKFYPVQRAPALGQRDSPFYRLDLDDVFREVDQKISKLK